MLKGLFPGTFDPPTKGHLQLIKRAASICDELAVGVGENSAKHAPILTISERVEVLQIETAQIKNVKITSFKGLTVGFARSIGAQVLIRGLRSGQDLEFEKQMAHANRIMGIDTLFLVTDSKEGLISSSLIRELAANGAPLSEYIPEGLEKRLHSLLKERK